eukprot:NODE_3278_length_793_cov_50.245968_g2737_i0.p1 GENE.NODE_3278_length_793_cov_50.245968_g2737_i0~~NODE_3278_length_793_cov_50.245968_g2737_i0.p1  ORF type:complete len:138 (+),score=23.79 NODE_3278_length_793_cov_50.245968_g2737_i0:219-632(+)
MGGGQQDNRTKATSKVATEPSIDGEGNKVKRDYMASIFSSDSEHKTLQEKNNTNQNGSYQLVGQLEPVPPPSGERLTFKEETFQPNNGADQLGADPVSFGQQNALEGNLAAQRMSKRSQPDKKKSSAKKLDVILEVS